MRSLPRTFALMYEPLSLRVTLRHALCGLHFALSLSRTLLSLARTCSRARYARMRVSHVLLMYEPLVLMYEALSLSVTPLMYEALS
jgi:hypothetical protein